MPAIAMAAAALDPAKSPAVARELPGLGEALSADAMRPRLAKLLDDTIERCTVSKRLYLPGQGCTMRYTVELSGPVPGQRRTHLVTGRPPGQGRGAEPAARAPDPAGRRGRARAHRSSSPSPPSSSSTWSCMPSRSTDLQGLQAATDPARALELARAVVPGASTCRVELVAYNRSERCVLRYHLDEGGPGARSCTPRSTPTGWARCSAAPPPS